MTKEDIGTRTGTVPLFAPSLPPKITSVSHAFLAQWKIKRREYEAELRARCRVSGENYDVVVTPIMESFNADLLDTFCELRLNIASADVTEDVLIAEIESIAGSVKNKTLPDVKALFKSKLRLNMTESDVYARVLDYFTAFGQIMRANGLTECFQGDDGAREKCERLVASLHPATLKAEVKQCVRFTHKPAASDPRLLFELIVDKATEHERQYQRLKTKKRDQSEVTKEKVKPKLDSAKDNKKKLPSTASETPRSKTASKSRTSTGKHMPPSPCPKCKEMHWIRDCPKSTDAEKEELRQKLREANSAKRSRLKRLGECLPFPGRKVTINGLLQLPYCPDSGSDHTVICRAHWELLKQKDPSVKSEKLDTPVKNQAFGSNWITADRKAKLHLLIHTAAGPVEPVSAVDVLIVDVDDDEFIVGNDLLTALGIDVDRQLEMLAYRGEDETCGDSIELEADDSPAKSDVGGSSDNDIFAAVERLIDRAVELGFPLDKVEQLRTTCHAYDIWRLELRADPPANVPPLIVRLQDGARPTK